MAENFASIGSKLDELLQKIDKLNINLQDTLLELLKINKNLTGNFKKIADEIIKFNKEVDGSCDDEYEKASEMLNQTYESLQDSSNPIQTLKELNGKLKMVLQIIGHVMDPDQLQNQLMKIREFIGGIE